MSPLALALTSIWILQLVLALAPGLLLHCRPQLPAELGFGLFSPLSLPRPDHVKSIGSINLTTDYLSCRSSIHSSSQTLWLFIQPVLILQTPQQEAQSTDWRRGSSERGRAVAGCPVFVLFVRPARIRFRLASPLPVFAIVPRDYSSRLLSNSGGPLKRLALGKACGLQRFLLLARIVLSSRSDSIRLRSLPIVARAKVHGLNHHEHPRPFEYRHPPSLSHVRMLVAAFSLSLS